MSVNPTVSPCGAHRWRLEIALTTIGLALSPFVFSQSEPDRTDTVLPLPKWIIIEGRPAESGVLPVLGGGLWPDDFNPDEIIHPPMAAAANEGGTALPGEQELWLRFLPRSLFGSRRATEPAPAEQPLTEMSDEAWHVCEKASGTTRLLDPQGLLSETQSEDLSRLLAFHSEQAGVSAWILLIDARQTLPQNADLSRLASGELAKGSACLAVYPVGAPERARLFFTRSVSEAPSSAYLESLRNGCIREAGLSPDPVEQLQRFATQLSIRLFWLERAYPVLKPKAKESPQVIEVAEPMKEVTSTEFIARPPSKFISLWQGIKHYVAGVVALVVLLALLALVVLRWRKRRQRLTVFRLPDFDPNHETRFGGPHCGGCGSSIHFG